MQQTKRGILYILFFISFNFSTETEITHFSELSENKIVINEIMFAPVKSQSEWIELYNNSDFSINLSGYSLSDKTTTILIKETVILNPREYLIITANFSIKDYYNIDSKIIKISLPALNNSGDILVLKNKENITVDSVNYSVASGYPVGISLERFSPDIQISTESNWSMSVNNQGATPGYKNSISLLTKYSFGTLVFSEILFDADNTYSEFIEFYNKSAFPVDIAGWKIIRNKKYSYILKNQNLVLNPGDYYLLAKDSCILNYIDNPELLNNLNISSNLVLSNESDNLILTDFFNTPIDSVFYKKIWHNKSFVSFKNRSLEKINYNFSSSAPSNWSSNISATGCSPLKENSINFIPDAAKDIIKIYPNPFSPDNDGFEDLTTININAGYPAHLVSGKIFDIRGSLKKDICSNKAFGPTVELIYDGRDNNGNFLETGLYLFYAEVFDSTNLNSRIIKTPIVIARKK